MPIQSFLQSQPPCASWHKTTFIPCSWLGSRTHCGKACLCSLCLGSLKAGTSVASSRPHLGTDASCWLGLHICPQEHPGHGLSMCPAMWADLTFLTAWQLDSKASVPQYQDRAHLGKTQPPKPCHIAATRRCWPRPWSWSTQTCGRERESNSRRL